MSRNSSILTSKNHILVESQLPHNQENTSHKFHTKMRTLSLMLNRLYINKISSIFEKINLIPKRWIRLQQRMKNTIEGVYKKQDYLAKWDIFQKIKRISIGSQYKDVVLLREVLKKQRGTAIRLLTAFILGKKRKNLHFILRKVKDWGDCKQFKINTNYRNALRKIIKVYNKKVQDYFNQLRNTKIIIHFVKTCKTMFRIMKQIKNQNTRWAFLNIRKQMLRSRKQKIGNEIKQIETKLGGGQDEELKGLKQRFTQLNTQLEQIKKQKDEITAGFEAEVKQAENRNKQMKDRLQQQKTKQQQMKKRILEIDQQQKIPFSLEQIYQLCYENFLWIISQSTQKTYSKQDLLKSLQTPMIPIDLPIPQLKQQNQVLKQLLSEYIIIYGQKKLGENIKIQLPYEYLLKQNNILYKILMTLLPNAQFLKDQLYKVKQTFEVVQNSLKQLKYK